jgi:hypothetical protein
MALAYSSESLFYSQCGGLIGLLAVYRRPLPFKTKKGPQYRDWGPVVVDIGNCWRSV